MSSSSLRRLPYAVAAGAWNMAADETLLESAIAGVASLRFYGWTEPTLSLGYFQPSALRLTDERWPQLPWVRRPTGGEALVHDRELTYAIALPAGAQWQPVGVSWALRWHSIVAASLADVGVNVHSAAVEHKHGDQLCFLHHTPGDLLLGDNKVVGSAQRRRRGALLQHGSILLAQSSVTAELPGIAERSDRRLTPDELAAAILKRLHESTGWEMAESTWTGAEQRATADFVSRRYTSSTWNEKR